MEGTASFVTHTAFSIEAVTLPDHTLNQGFDFDCSLVYSSTALHGGGVTERVMSAETASNPV